MTVPDGPADDRPRRLRLDLGLDRRRRRPTRSRPRCRRSSASDFLVRTGKEAAEQQAQDLSDALGFIRTALLVFAGVALLVGGFLIFNTFTVTVAQRTKEFALLRVLGASRAQVLRSVLVETFIVGARRVDPRRARRHRRSPRRWRRMLAAFGIDLGTTGLVITPAHGDHRPRHRPGRDDGLRLRAGPARDPRGAGDGDARQRHARASGICAGGGSSARSRCSASACVALFYGLFGGIDSGSGAASLLGLGAVLMMFGVAFLAPLLVRPLARGLGCAAGPHAGPDGRPGARERDPPAAAHRGHRRRADGRPRARRAGHDLRRRPARLGRQDDRRPGLGRADRPEQGRLHADPGQASSTRWPRCRASTDVVPDPLRRRARQGRRRQRPPPPASIPRPSAPCSSSSGIRATRRRWTR